jgi:hypothetical protein
MKRERGWFLGLPGPLICGVDEGRLIEAVMNIEAAYREARWWHVLDDSTFGALGLARVPYGNWRREEEHECRAHLLARGWRELSEEDRASALEAGLG